MLIKLFLIVAHALASFAFFAFLAFSGATATILYRSATPFFPF